MRNFVVALQAVRLAHGQIGHDAEPGQILDDGIGVFRPAALGVGVVEAARRGKRYEVEDVGVGIVRFADGRALLLEAAYFLNEREPFQRAVLYGTLGGARLGGGVTVDMFRVRGENVEDIPVAPDESAPRSAVEHFVNVLRGREELSSTAEQAATGLRICEAIIESARTGEAVVWDRRE